MRSAFAAKTLSELGYADVASVAGGFNKWKDEGREWGVPKNLTAEQRNRYQRHLLLPEVDIEGQIKLLEAKVLLLGVGGLGSPAVLYLAAAGVGIVGMDVADARCRGLLCERCGIGNGRELKPSSEDRPHISYTGTSWSTTPR